MWILTVRSPASDPREFAMPAGKFTIGRRLSNDIVVAEESAALEHAVLELEPQTDTLTVHALASTNGTFVNHEEITHYKQLHSGDQIRIGQHLIRVVRGNTASLVDAPGVAGTQPLTRALLLASVDRHAVLFVEASERLNALTDLSRALEAVAAILGTALGVDHCQVIPFEQFSQLADLGLPVALAQRAIRERAVVAIPDVQTRPDLVLNPNAQRLGVRSIILVPTLVGEVVAALIYVQLPARADRELTQEDVHIAVAISHLASLTIQRLRLLQNMEAFKALTTTDSLTQLYHRNYFMEMAEQEVKRARRFQRPLSAIMVDIDYMQQLNDAHGRAVGDEILRAVAARCRLALRQVDLPGRYGGDEFAILGLETDLDRAYLVAERLRKQVANSPIYTEGGLVHVTISLGLAALSDRSPKLTLLLAEAEAALQVAKSSGGNRVEIAGGSQPDPR